jgi:hypothetical protein
MGGQDDSSKRPVKRVFGTMGDLSDVRASRSSAPMPMNEERLVVERSRAPTLGGISVDSAMEETQAVAVYVLISRSDQL